MKEISALRLSLWELGKRYEKLQEENHTLAAGQCIFNDSTGLVGDEYGHSICLKDQKLKEAALMVDIFRACIETRILPSEDSPCMDKIKEILDD